MVIRPPSHKEGVQLSADVNGEASWVPGVQVHSVVSYTFEAVCTLFPCPRLGFLSGS